MFYTVEIILDYDHHPAAGVREVAAALKLGLTQAGFRCDGHRYIINQSPLKARRLARVSMEKIARRLSRKGINLYHYIHEYYGYPSTCVENLLLPPAEAFEVRAGIAV